MSVYFNALNSGPPDLEEWFKKMGQSLVPKKKSPLLNQPEQKESSVWWWVIIAFILCLVVLVFSSVVTVKPTEKLVVTRFGAFNSVDGPGLHWTIPLVDQRTLVDVTQVLTVSDQGLFLTQDKSLVKLSVTLNYQVTDPKTYLFYGPVSTLLQQQLAAATTQVLQNQTAVSLLSTHAWTNLNTQIQAALPTLALYGISLQGVTVNNVAVPDSLSQKFNAPITTAQNQVQQMIDTANQFAASIKPLAAQEAEQALRNANTEQFSILVHAQRDAADLQSLQAAYAVNPAVTTAYLPILLQRNSVTAALLGSSQSQMSNQNSAYLRWQAGNAAQSQEEQDAQAN